MDTRKKQEIFQKMVSVVTALLCFASFITSAIGLYMIGASVFIAILVALSGAAFAFVAWFGLGWRFPAVPARTKLYLGIVMVVFIGLLFFFSTQFSVITLGGKEAVSVHMQTVLTEADKEGLKLLRRGSEEANLAPQLESLARQFESYALREAGGAFSGLPGEGEVVATLRNTSTTFGSLADSVRETEDTRKRFYETLKLKVNEARDVLTAVKESEAGQEEELPLRVINLRFSSKLAEINEALTRMSETSTVDFLIAVNRNLGTLTVVIKEGTRTEQREAIIRLRKIIDAAQDTLTQLTNQEELVDVKVSTFTMIGMNTAVFKYYKNLTSPWAYAIALDFAPLLFIFFLTAIWAFNKDEMETEATLEEARVKKEEAETLLQDAETKAQEVFRKVEAEATQMVEGLVEKAGPHIKVIAEGASRAVEGSAEDLIHKIRAEMQSALEAVQKEGQDWMSKIQESRFKV